jgi:hypothetical protein
MTNDNIILEHLKHIRRKVDNTANDIIDLKERVSNLESGQISHQRSLDRLSERVGRIEDRLDLRNN